jgi:hypothetical protein
MSPSITDYTSSNGQDYTTSFMDGKQQQQNSSPDYDIEANAAIIISEAEKLFYKLVKGSMNKVITDRTFNKSSLPSSLPLLSPSDEQQSHVKSSPTGNQTYVHKEHAFIRSEIGNEDQDNQING